MTTKGTQFLHAWANKSIENHGTKYESNPTKSVVPMWMLQVYAHEGCTYDNIQEISRIMVEIDVACAGEGSVHYELMDTLRDIIPRLYEALGIGDVEVDSNFTKQYDEYLIITPDVDDNPMYGFADNLTDYIESDANNEPRTIDDSDNNIPLLSKTDIAIAYSWTLSKRQVEKLLRRHKDIRYMPYTIRGNTNTYVSIHSTVKERNGEKYISIYDYEDGYRMAIDAGYGDDLIASVLIHLQQKTKV